MRTYMYQNMIQSQRHSYSNSCWTFSASSESSVLFDFNFTLTHTCMRGVSIHTPVLGMKKKRERHVLNLFSFCWEVPLSGSAPDNSCSDSFSAGCSDEVAGWDRTGVSLMSPMLCILLLRNSKVNKNDWNELNFVCLIYLLILKECTQWHSNSLRIVQIRWFFILKWQVDHHQKRNSSTNFEFRISSFHSHHSTTTRTRVTHHFMLRTWANRVIKSGMLESKIAWCCWLISLVSHFQGSMNTPPHSTETQILTSGIIPRL